MTTPVHFGKYHLIDKIGTGGMAELYMAKQTGLKGFEKVMAIKRILPHLTEDLEFVSMFINEAKLAAMLSHQNIVQIFDLGHVENAYFIAMEYVIGKDLRTILHRAKALHQPLSIGHALLIISKVCAGLDYAHRKKDMAGRDLNIVHRDISPQNILVSYEGEVKLVDFGIAKAASQSSETRTGILKGKLSYMAPEQAWGKPVDRRADIFAIGIVLYESLTGHKLFKGDNDFNTLEKVREARIEPPPATLNRQVSPELEAVILKALAREPEQRFQSAAELQTALEDHMSQKGFDFSTVRLAQYLNTLFQHDIARDSQRLQIASGESPTASVADQKTAVRRRPPSSSPEQTPSHPSRRIRTPSKPAETDREGPSAFRIMILTVLLIMSTAVLISTINPPFLRMLSRSSPEVHAASLRLSQWPAHAVAWAYHRFQLRTPPPAFPDGASLTTASPPGESTTPSDEFVSSAAPEPTAEDGPERSARPKSILLPSDDETAAPDSRRPAREEAEIQRLLGEARAAYNDRRLDEMERKLRRIIELNPKVPIAYHLLGTLSMERKDPQAAMRIFEEASRKFPNDPLLHYDLGFLYFKQGVISLAHDELTKALRIDPGGPGAERARNVLMDISASPVKKSEGSESEP